MTFADASTWYSAAELAALALPGLPRTTKGLIQRATADGWQSAKGRDGTPLARKRSGRGGGWEYSPGVLPEYAARALLGRRVADPKPIAATEARSVDHASRWEWFEAQGEKAKAEARRRLDIIGEVETLIAAGLSKRAAIAETSARWKAHGGAAASSIFNWFALIAAVSVADRLAFIAPDYCGGGKEAELHDDLWQMLRSDYLRLSKPTFDSSYRRVAGAAKMMGLPIPSSRTLRRRFETEIDPVVVTLCREGIDAIRQHLPPQQRTVAHLHALELVNIDGHTCDVRVRFPDGTTGRPVLIAIQDVMSRKFLAWRYAPSEDAVTARLCFADLFAKYGIPKGLLSDNGRAFACKWLTGGMPTRFRFKVKQDEPWGLMKMLGIQVHWALPFRGSSKPIERGFRDFCDAIAKHPAFEGAYTGNNALNKPDNYGERAVDWADFVRVWDVGIAEHNARTGRRTEMAQGSDSFDQVFARSYATAPIRKASESHLRLALMAGEQVRAVRGTGAVKVLGNSYWCADLVNVAGDLMTVRYDPEDATQPVHVYDAVGRLVAVADLLSADGFDSAASAKRRARLESDHRKKAKAAAASLDLLTADQLAAQFAALLPAYEDEAPLPEPTVIAPVRVSRGGSAALRKAAPIPAATSAEPSFIEHFASAARRLRVVE